MILFGSSVNTARVMYSYPQPTATRYGRQGEVYGMAACATCGAALGIGRRLMGAKRCQDCEQKAKTAKDSALAQYDEAVSAVITIGRKSAPEADRLGQLERGIAEGGGSFVERKVAAYRTFIDQALGDEILTAEEEQRLVDIGEALYRTPDRLGAVLAPYKPQIFIAMVNDGRLPVATSTRLILKKGEVLHLEEPASLLKEIVQREYRGGSQGVSFRIAKGVYYRVGAQRGQMVEVGRSWQPDDSGVVSVTSHRMVFAGSRRSVEMAYAKLLSLNVFTDAIQVHVSNRQNPTTMQVTNGPMIAAAVNAAMQRLLA
jgi:hypothetical protein